jgi:hypothetical protein
MNARMYALGIISVVALCLVVGIWAQTYSIEKQGASSNMKEGQQRPQTQEHLQRLIYSVKGSDLFGAHCAACHGGDAKGNGPLASALKVKVPDLTVLAKNNGGVFPAVGVRRMIAGDKISTPHGSREMPTWGPLFHQIEWDQDLGNVRLDNLVKYLESIQQK